MRLRSCGDVTVALWWRFTSGTLPTGKESLGVFHEFGTSGTSIIGTSLAASVTSGACGVPLRPYADRP
jgi:hypothetical protein